MAYSNSIALASAFVPMLDEVYKAGSKTSILDGAEELAREGANAGELIIPKMVLDDLADYSRNSGYQDGNVTITSETVQCNYDRGRMFQVDAMDNQETAGVAFGRLAGEFIRVKVVPEVDTFRLGMYATNANGKAAGALTTAAAAIAAIRTGVTTMDNAEVPAEGRVLFITPTLDGMIADMDNDKSRRVLETFEQVIVVPSGRMLQAVTLTTAGGFTGTNAINFMIVEKSAVIQFTKHVAPKIITPEANQHADAWKFGYRIHGIADVYDNKTAGIYVHTATTIT